MADDANNPFFGGTDSLQPPSPLSNLSPASLAIFNSGRPQSVQPQNAVEQYTSQIQKIAGGQSFASSIMGRGLTVDNFNSPDILNNWSQNYPYRLLVLRVTPAGNYRVVAAFRLPINPQSIRITTPYAIKTTITSQGVLEEHNGIPIKQITIKGTTGFFIAREQAGKTQQNTGILGTVFSGTLAAVQNFQSNLGSLTSTITAPAGLQGQDQSIDSNLSQSGYFQYHMLRLFIDTYVEVKKYPNTQDLRLAFEMAKDRVTYLVTPMTREEERSVASPMEYMYTIPFLAWGTVPNAGFATAVPQLDGLVANDVGSTRKLFNSLYQLRNTISAASNIVTAAHADIESNIFGPINQVILLSKDILNIPKTIADFPKSLRQSFQHSVVANWNSLKTTLQSSPNLNTSGPASPIDSGVIAAFSAKVQDITNENSGSNSFNGTSSAVFDPNTLDNITITSAIDLSQINLSAAQQASVNTAVSTALDTTNNQIMSLITNLNQLSDTLEPTITALGPLEPEWDILYQTHDTINNLYAFLADGQIRNSQNEANDASGNPNLATDALTFWDESSAANDIPFDKPVGKFSIPFPFRSTLEQLASIYLADPTKWTEIAALNGLQYPYVDEDGFTNLFIGNGSENQFNIPSGANLYVGQIIYLSSTTQSPQKRKITKIAEITTTNFLITVDGASNLEFFTSVDQAQMKAYLPYTINSMKQIYIPLQSQPTQNELNTKPLTFIDDDINLVKFSRIDWLLDSNFDLAITQDGFVNLAFGKTNLIQAAVLKLKTPAQSLLLHPEYGAIIEIGENMADFDPKTAIESINTSFTSDERFNTPSSVQITQQSGVITVSVVVSVAQGNGVLPITVPLSQ